MLIVIMVGGGEEEVVMDIYELQQLWQEGRAAA